MADKAALKDLVSSFLKYLIAGGIAFVADFTTLMLCYELLGMHHLLAATLGFSLGVLVTYICSNTFVFSRRKMGDKQAAEFTIFTIIGIVGLLLTLLFMWFFVDICAGIWSFFGLSAYAVALSKLVTEGIVLLWNFGARKIILY